MRLVAVCLWSGVAGTAYAGPQMQFDLKCAGTAKTDVEPTGRPFQRTIHVDLNGRQYCNDECASVRPIASVDPLRIALEWGEASALAMNRVTVDRRTGAYVLAQLNVKPNTWIIANATCSPAPFTAFPITRF